MNKKAFYNGYMCKIALADQGFSLYNAAEEAEEKEKEKGSTFRLGGTPSYTEDTSDSLYGDEDFRLALPYNEFLKKIEDSKKDVAKGGPLRLGVAPESKAKKDNAFMRALKDLTPTERILAASGLGGTVGGTAGAMAGDTGTALKAAIASALASGSLEYARGEGLLGDKLKKVLA